MESGSQQLSRIATAHLASLGFAATFLLATAFGADGLTALFRGVVVALFCTVLGGPLSHLVIATVLDAMARDRAQASAAAAEAEEGP